MSSVFAVQVRTGQEIEAKQMLLTVLNRAGDRMVKAVYAMESVTHVLPDAQEDVPSTFDPDAVSYHLHLKRLNEYLGNLRMQYAELRKSAGQSAEQNTLRETYRESIRRVQSLIKTVRRNAKSRMKSVLPGYILVELLPNFHTLPATLWHLIKTTPNVIRVVSRNNIPEDQLKRFFETTEEEMEPVVQVAFEEEVRLVEDRIREARELLHQANTTDDIKKKKERFKAVEQESKTMVEQVNEIKESIDPDSSLKRLVQRCKAFVRRKKETFVFPIRLFETVRNDLDPHHQKRSLKDLVSEIVKSLQCEVRIE